MSESARALAAIAAGLLLWYVAVPVAEKLARVAARYSYRAHGEWP